MINPFADEPATTPAHEYRSGPPKHLFIMVRGRFEGESREICLRADRIDFFYDCEFFVDAKLGDGSVASKTVYGTRITMMNGSELETTESSAAVFAKMADALKHES